jgi:hypothetical protein
MQFRNSIPKLHKNDQYPKYLMIFHKKSRGSPALYGLAIYAVIFFLHKELSIEVQLSGLSTVDRRPLANFIF